LVYWKTNGQGEFINNTNDTREFRICQKTLDYLSSISSAFGS